jgi:hypothetical protein
MPTPPTNPPEEFPPFSGILRTYPSPYLQESGVWMTKNQYETLRQSHARVAELERLLDPAVVTAARGLVAHADAHPDGCCRHCRKGLAERDQLKIRVAELEAALVKVLPFVETCAEAEIDKAVPRAAAESARQAERGGT